MSVTSVKSKSASARGVKLLGACLLFIICAGLMVSDRGAGLTGVAFSGDTNVRIALATGQQSVSVAIMKGKYTLRDPDTGNLIESLSEGQSVRFSPSGAGLSIKRDGADLAYTGVRALFEPGNPAEDLITYSSRSYRGVLTIENKGGALNVINTIDVDLYLLGVLPLEMGMSSAPSEALKAQAVVSRSFALNKKTNSGSYDMAAGTGDQMYGGFSAERAHTSAAVEATKGQVILYDGEVIRAFFSSNSGGYTEDAENVWNEALPYAKAIESPFDSAAMEAAQDANGYPALSYQWQVRYTLKELNERIRVWNSDNPDNRINIGDIRSINAGSYMFDPDSRKITDRQNKSGRVTRLDLIGSVGSCSLYKQNIRSFLGLRSALFTVEPEGGVSVMNGAGVTVMLNNSIRESFGIIADGIASAINPGSDSYYVMTANGAVEMKKDAASVVSAYVFNGRGYGHGVGLSQWGAIGMANKGIDYGQIIEYYYNQNKNDGRLAIRDIR